VPVASDVDCEGKGGNGPAYVRGPVRVVGSDIYGLDRDGDGIGCEGNNLVPVPTPTTPATDTTVTSSANTTSSRSAP
jgi:hypothetical protein